MKGQVMERGQRCEARGHKGKRDEGGRMRSAEKGERERERNSERKRQGEVGRNGKRRKEHTRYPEPWNRRTIGPGALFNKSQLMRVIDHRGMR